MSQKQRGLFAVAILLIGAVLISSCTFSLSKTPAATPTLIPTGLFVSPFPSVENPMDMIQEFARETAAAQTAIASGQTPLPPSTPVPAVTGTVLTPQIGVTSTNTPPATPTNPGATAAVIVPSVTPGGPTLTPVPQGVRPTTYILAKNEFPFCIARRFNLNPQDLLAASGLTSPDVYYEGQRLTIPQNSVWPAEAGPRALRAHPGTYTVTGDSDTTIGGVACKYGDVDPNAIAQANAISVSAALTVGQQIKIP